MKRAINTTSYAATVSALIAAGLWFWVSANPYKLTLDSLVADLQDMAVWNKAASFFTGLAVILGAASEWLRRKSHSLGM
jgi:hypothetical protein